MNQQTNSKPQIRVIKDEQQLQRHIEALIDIEPRFDAVYQQVGMPDLRRNQGGFVRLIRAMVGQQLSVAAASSIWNKLESAGLIYPQAIIDADDDQLRAHGLSKQKIRYIRSLVAHDIDFESLEVMTDEEVIKTLTAVTGIGKWTAEMYLLFSLGRADVLAVDDLAIKVGAMDLLQLDARPTPKQLRDLTQDWSPYRSAASLLLWSHYGWLKDRQALPV
ncbi:DNA-3-methyladenine glycosylase family protein [Psychrobacter sp. FDAARGOS_221]|uniref:DNA-3-methyladenine glycosylase family protein n=1 Tax=Psychrobacter sp. FDAARGOS_221 TaxID=1975705 RepID=UPI000BB5526C|nr:DNA-3-methyladenine glycosylase [Psychrobacter sp. FDAARGOS_221]PNK60264.1 DNA-3-methyladenine glycosylase 2 family protein [Psychrobacter sp. FDAARGOS_221]